MILAFLEFANAMKTVKGITSLVFSYDNKILASGSSDKTIKLWNL